MDYTSPVITDELDFSLIKFVGDSVKVNGTQLENSKYTYDDASGKLTINIDDVGALQTTTITFEVEKTNA